MHAVSAPTDALETWSRMDTPRLLVNARELAFALGDPAAEGEYLDLSPFARACIQALADRLETCYSLEANRPGGCWLKLARRA